MNVGPLQMVVIGFERTDRFKGEIMRELEELRTGGVEMELVDEAVAAQLRDDPSGRAERLRQLS